MNVFFFVNVGFIEIMMGKFFGWFKYNDAIFFQLFSQKLSDLQNVY